MTAFYFLLMLIGVVCFVVSAFRKDVRGLDLTALGLAFVFLVPLIQYLKQL